MLRQTSLARNTHLTNAFGVNPSNVIHSGPHHWSDPERMYRQKLMYFYMGLDQQPLRRTAVIQADKQRLRQTYPDYPRADPTGFKKARVNQMILWHKRIQYQEWYLQHLMTRHMWGLLRMYPTGGGKIDGKVDDGYFGYDVLGYHRYNRQPLSFPAKEIYPRRK